MSLHKIGVLRSRMKLKPVFDLLNVQPQSVVGQVLQIKSLPCLVNKILPISTCVNGTVNRRIHLQQQHFSQRVNNLSRLLLIENPYSLHNLYNVNRKLYSTAPQQKQERDRGFDSTNLTKSKKENVLESAKDKKEEAVSRLTDSRDLEEKDPEPPEDPGIIKGIFKRFKDAYKQYGKALIAVHAATSTVWFGTFYYAAAAGVDIAGILQKIGASDTIIEQLQNTGLGYAAVAYLMYKLATPARYTVTILGTQVAVKYMRRLGYMEPVPEGDSIKELWKEGKSEVKTKYVEKKGEMKDKYVEKKGEMKEKVGDLREDLKDKAEEFRDDVKEKLKDKAEELRDEVKEKLKDKATDMKEELKDKFVKKKDSKDSR